ncbi:MAG: hypothetical protein AAGD92_04505 [Pseudomonadota bacterium]
MKPNKYSIPLLIALFAACVFLIQQTTDSFHADEGRLIARADTSRDAVVLRWSSEVEAPMGRRFEEAYDEWRDRVSLFIIELDSPGGALAEGKRVIEAVDRMKRTHNVETRVRSWEKCLSMCVPIFLKGDRRVAAANSRWMFHEPTSYDAVTGERVDEPEFERRYVADRFFDRYFANSPMTPEWRAWLQQEWVGKDVWKSGRDLYKEGSGVVTELE